MKEKTYGKWRGTRWTATMNIDADHELFLWYEEEWWMASLTKNGETVDCWDEDTFSKAFAKECAEYHARELLGLV